MHKPVSGGFHDHVILQRHFYTASFSLERIEACNLFNRIAAAWPERIDISDRKSNASGGHWFPLLAEENRKLEESIDHAVDVWGSLGAWAFYQAIVSYANERYEAGDRWLLSGLLPVGIFDQKVRKNLQAKGFEKEVGEYAPI